MTTQASDTSVRRSITVQAPIDRAFSVFTDGIETWWNPNHHLLEGKLKEMMFDPFVGGHIRDIGVDGSEGPERTLVELEHRNLERHGEGWESMRSAVDAPDGWSLQPFADALTAA